MKAKPFEKKKILWPEIAILFLILASAVIIRVPYLSEPFEAEQASYAYISNNWGDGTVPYRDYWDNKPPLIYIFYRLVCAFLGYSERGIHLGFVFLSAATILFFYGLSRRLFSRGFALISTFLYGIFSAGALISGTFAVPENLEVFFVIAGIYYFWDGCERQKNNRFFIAGVFMGLALMTKQAAVWQITALILFFVLTGLRSTTFMLVGWRLILFSFGSVLMPLFFILLFAGLGSAAEFFNCVFIYNLFFGRLGYIREGFFNLWKALSWTPRENFLLWVFAMLGTIIAFSKRERKTLLIILWICAVVLGLASSVRFYPHYFILAIPVLVILAVYFFQIVWDLPGIRGKFLSLIFISVTVCCFSAEQWNWWFLYTPFESLIKRRGAFARPELYGSREEASAYIKSRTNAEDAVYVWGLWPEVYYASRRKAPTKYFYLPSRGSLVGKFREVVQTQVYYDMLRNPPKYIIVDGYFEDLIGQSMQRYINSSYALVKKGDGYWILRRKF
jgi:4-amino-4-deoxy-L-arabinose transferase-like glycosyltransferase